MQTEEILEVQEMAGARPAIAVTVLLVPDKS